MNELIERIRAAVADGATDEAKQAGADACRAILTALGAKPGQALAVPAAPLAGAPTGPDASQVLDLLIAKLRTMVDEKAAPKAPPTGAYRVELVPVPRGHG